MKLLESNKVNQSAFSGIATNYLASEYQNGYIKDVLQEFAVSLISSNTISISPGVVLIEGARVFNEENYNISITSFPDTTLLYQLILKLEVNTSGDNNISVQYRATTSLQKDNILKEGTGIYELELATFELSRDGISNFKQQLLPIILQNEELQDLKEQLDELEISLSHIEQQIITANEDATKALNIVNNISTTTTTTEPGTSANVNITTASNGYKTFNFNIPTGQIGPQGEKGESGTGIDLSYDFAKRFASSTIYAGGSKSSITSSTFTEDQLTKLQNAQFALIQLLYANTYYINIIVEKNKAQQLFLLVSGEVSSSGGSLTYLVTNIKWNLNADNKLVFTAISIISNSSSSASTSKPAKFTHYWQFNHTDEGQFLSEQEISFGEAEGLELRNFYIIS